MLGIREAYASCIAIGADARYGKARSPHNGHCGPSDPSTRMQSAMSTMRVHHAQRSDAGRIAEVYNEGIAEREATFETEPREASDFLARIACERYPLLVAELEGSIVGWAGLAPYSERSAYAGVGECSVYVARAARGQGVGRELCRRLTEEARGRGFYKLLGKVFPTNVACVRLVSRCGFREVGLHRCHGRLDGEWRDVLLVERLLGDAERLPPAGREAIGGVPVDLPQGEKLDWTAVEPPVPVPLGGSHVLLRPVDAATDAEPLYAVSHPPDGDPAIWTYLPDGPYESPEHLRRMLAWAETSQDPLYFTLVRLRDERPLGQASYLRITQELGVIEIGHIWFGVPLQRTTAATEAIYLLARHAFDDLGYRRLEWKCNALNAASRRAAERFGFVFEGVFRKHQIVKGRNRDTAWYAILDEDWPAIRAGFQAWLAAENFDSEGRQVHSLGELISRSRG
jgi:RimJ/RimL family protein N-acetyltransferase